MQPFSRPRDARPISCVVSTVSRQRHEIIVVDVTYDPPPVQPLPGDSPTSISLYKDHLSFPLSRSAYIRRVHCNSPNTGTIGIRSNGTRGNRSSARAKQAVSASLPLQPPPSITPSHDLLDNASINTRSPGSQRHRLIHNHADPRARIRRLAAQHRDEPHPDAAQIRST